MATTALLIEASPWKLKQSTLVRTFRPLPSKSIFNLSTATFSYQRCLFAPGPRFKNTKPPQSYSLPAKKTHYCTVDSKSNHNPSPSLCQCLNVFKDNRSAAANPNNIISESWDKFHKAFRKPVVAAVLLSLLVMYNPNSAALATPVGRVGGSLPSKSLTSFYDYHPSENSSTEKIVTSYDCVSYYDPIWDWILIGLLCIYFVGGMYLTLILRPCPKLVRAISFILWSVLLATWFHSLGQTSVVKLQLKVNLSNTRRAVQMDLNRIAEAANPHTHEGLRYLLADTAVALLRQPDYCISGYSSVIIPNFGRATAMKCFNKLVVQERVRQEEEMDIIKSQSTANQRSADESNNDDVVVVTLLLAAEGKSKSLTITNISDVKRVLEEIASIDPSKRILAVEIFWRTPQLSSNAASNVLSN